MPVQRTVGTLEFNQLRSSLATISFALYFINPPIQYVTGQINRQQTRGVSDRVSEQMWMAENTWSE